MARAVKPSTIAETVLRLAVLLQAGVAPARAWAYLADAGDAEAARVHAAVVRGMPLATAIATAAAAPASPPPAAGGLEDATRQQRTGIVARRVGRLAGGDAVGAPLAESLRALSAALRDAQEAADEVRVALAEPAATAQADGLAAARRGAAGRRARLRHPRHAGGQPHRARVPCGRASP